MGRGWGDSKMSLKGPTGLEVILILVGDPDNAISFPSSPVFFAIRVQAGRFQRSQDGISC